MVRVTSLIVAIVLFVVIIGIAFMILGGSVPVVDTIVEKFREFVSGVK